MIVTTYTCDKCNTNVKPDQLFRVHLEARRAIGASVSYRTPFKTEDRHFCGDCFEALGFRRYDEPKPDPAPHPMLEDLIVELIHAHAPRPE